MVVVGQVEVCRTTVRPFEHYISVLARPPASDAAFKLTRRPFGGCGLRDASQRPTPPYHYIKSFQQPRIHGKQSFTYDVDKFVLARLSFSRFLLATAVLLGAVFIGYRWNKKVESTRGEPYHDEKFVSSPPNNPMMKLIVTGATGAAGLEVVRAAIIDPAISRITILSRKPLPPTIPASDKITEILHSDFLSYSPELMQQLEGHGACVWAQGKSAVGMSETDYTRLTHDFPLAAFKAFNDANVRGEDGTFRFVYISGEGTDQEEKSRMMFSRVKGRTEKDLISYASNDLTLKVHNLRPGYFFPSNPQDAARLRSGFTRILDKVFSPALYALAPSTAIKSSELGQFAVEAAKGRCGDQTVIQNIQMVNLVKSWKKEEKSD